MISKKQPLTVWQMLKKSNNIYLWELIRQLIQEDVIHLPTLIKIKAHADNSYHNLLDSKIKEHYEDMNRVYLIRWNHEELKHICYFLTWNNIIIDKKI